MKRALSPVTNSAGLSSAALAVYAAVAMIYNAASHHGVISVPVIVAAVAAAAALYTRQKVTPVADPKDGNGAPLQVTVVANPVAIPVGVTQTSGGVAATITTPPLGPAGEKLTPPAKGL
jgi:hypothetical protein